MFENILLPTDGSKGAESAVERAIELARISDATLHVLYVVDTSAAETMDGHGGFALSALEEAGQETVGKVADRVRASGVENVSSVVERGVPHRTILEYADERDIDCIVMGTHGRTGVERFLLGSVTEKVVRLSEVPVLTVRLADEDAEQE